jgi:PTH1 family peptidyl-tRNA hydrolase
LADSSEGGFLVVGLGNPGKGYESTRHNVGFMVLDRLLADWGAPRLSRSSKFGGDLAQVRHAGQRVFVLKPMGYMNLSGGPVSQVAQYFHVAPANILVIADDVNLPFGTLRLRARGGPGGHNGLKSIQQALGTDEYMRFRIGVGGGDPGRDLTGHVLAPFSSGEKKSWPRVLDRCAEAVETVLARGLAVAASQYNGSALGETSEGEVG